MPFQVILSHLKSKSDIFQVTSSQNYCNSCHFKPIQAIYSKNDFFPNFLQFMQLQVMPLQLNTRAVYIDFTSMHVYVNVGFYFSELSHLLFVSGDLFSILRQHFLEGQRSKICEPAEF